MSSPMHEDAQFHRRAETLLNQCFDALEPAYEDGLLEELEREAELLTLVAESGQTLILSLHNASREIWLASPLSGGSHFAWDETAQSWRTRDGRDLLPQLSDDLRACGIEVTL